MKLPHRFHHPADDRPLGSAPPPAGGGPDEGRLTDLQIDLMLGNLLRTAVLISAAFVLAGGAIYLLRHGGDRPDYSVFRGEPEAYRTVTGIVHSTKSVRARGIIQVGVILLLATPVVRVVFALVAFSVQRDRLYVTVAGIVLAVLFYSILGGYL